MIARYHIIEGSPKYVAQTCNEALERGWCINGPLHVTTIGDNVLAFQGITKCDQNDVSDTCGHSTQTTAS